MFVVPLLLSPQSMLCYRASSVFIAILILPDVDCGAPPSISDGSRTIAGTTLGETATYSCNIGFSISGSAIITCLASGSWEPEPACTRELLSECVGWSTYSVLSSHWLWDPSLCLQCISWNTHQHTAQWNGNLHLWHGIWSLHWSHHSNSYLYG